MYIHLGNDVVVSAVDVIAILNIEDLISADLRDIIEIAEIEKKLTIISKNEKRKALVICDNRSFISPISSTTLYKRASHYPKEV